MKISQAFPTKFAMAICEKIGLHGKDVTKTGGMHSAMDLDMHIRLSEFQQMVIGGAKFKNALLAYHGIELQDDQLTGLKLVEQSTKPWILGHIAGVLTEKLNGTNNRDMIAAAEILLESIINGGDEPSSRSAKTLLVRLQK